MSPLDDALADYLKIRRALGYKLERAGKLLAQYLDHLDQRSEPQVTIENDLAWATLPTGDANWWAFRMSVVRGFASYLHALDPAHQVPPKDLLPRTMRRMTPYLYSDQEIQARVRTRPDNYRPRARWVTFRPAQVDQYSGGAHKTTPGRHRSTAEGRRRAVGGPQDCWPPTRRFVVRELRCPESTKGWLWRFHPEIAFLLRRSRPSGHHAEVS